MNILRSVAYPLLAAPFIVDGISAVRAPAPHAQKLMEAWRVTEKMGAPELSEETAILASRVGGIAGACAGMYLIVGKHKRLAATALAVATLPLGLINGPLGVDGNRRERRQARQRLLNYGALTGGLLFAAMDRNGKPSRKWRRTFRRHEKELVAAAKQSVAIQKAAN